MSLVIRLVGGASRAWLKYGCRSVTISGLEQFKAVIDDPHRARGILTFSNHQSVLDDPVVWGVLPPEHFRSSRRIRWTLGASDICFTNPVFRWFFDKGQVIETIRGGGIYQAAVDRAVSLLQNGHWVHIFPEGYVNQSHPYNLLQFRWGVARMLMESPELPHIIPIWIRGFDQIMPENRPFPRFLPRPGADISVTFGSPLDSSSMQQLEKLKIMYMAAKVQRKDGEDSQELQDVRKKVAALLQDSIEVVGEQTGEKVVRKER